MWGEGGGGRGHIERRWRVGGEGEGMGRGWESRRPRLTGTGDSRPIATRHEGGCMSAAAPQTAALELVAIGLWKLLVRKQA